MWSSVCVPRDWGFLSFLFEFPGHLCIEQILLVPWLHPSELNSTCCRLLSIECLGFCVWGLFLIGECAQSVLRASFYCLQHSSQPITDVGVAGELSQFPCLLVGWILRHALVLYAGFQSSSEDARSLLAFFPPLYHFFPRLLVCVEDWNSNPCFWACFGRTQPKILDTGFYFKIYMWLSACRTWLMVPCGFRSESGSCHRDLWPWVKFFKPSQFWFAYLKKV